MDIVIIGAQKAGTTWLFSMLTQQPRLGFSFMKEVHYFDEIAKPYFDVKSRVAFLQKRKKKSRRILGSGQSAYYNYVFNEKEAFTDDWYRSTFCNKPENRQIVAKFGSIVYCDATPSYCAMPEDAVVHMAKVLPDIVPILVVRDPVKRMISGFSMSLLRRSERKLWSVEEGIEHLRNRQVPRGDYASMIPLFKKHFSDLMIIPFGQIHVDPQGVMRNIEQRYGLDRLRYRGLKGKRNSHTGKVELQPEILQEINRLCIPQFNYLANEFGQEFLITI